MKNNNKKIELKVVEDWNDITLNEWKRLLKLSSEMKNDESPLEVYKVRLEQVKILNPAVDEADIKKMTISQLKSYFDMIDFLDTEPVKANQETIEIDGETFKFNDFRHMSLEQWIDAEKYSSIEDADKLIAIFYLNAENYSNDRHEKVSKWLDSQPAHIGFWTVGKFFFIQKALEVGMELYSEEIIKKTQKIQRVIENSKKINEALSRFGSRFSIKSLNMTWKK